MFLKKDKNLNRTKIGHVYSKLDFYAVKTALATDGLACISIFEAGIRLTLTPRLYYSGSRANKESSDTETAFTT